MMSNMRIEPISNLLQKALEETEKLEKARKEMEDFSVEAPSHCVASACKSLSRYESALTNGRNNLEVKLSDQKKTQNMYHMMSNMTFLGIFLIQISMIVYSLKSQNTTYMVYSLISGALIEVVSKPFKNGLNKRYEKAKKRVKLIKWRIEEIGTEISESMNYRHCLLSNSFVSQKELDRIMKNRTARMGYLIRESDVQNELISDSLEEKFRVIEYAESGKKIIKGVLEEKTSNSS